MKVSNQNLFVFEFDPRTLICENHISCGQWSIIAHAFIHQTCKPASWQKTNRQTMVMTYDITPFSNICPKCLKKFLTMPMCVTSSKYGIPIDHIFRLHFFEHVSNILHVPTFCIYVNQTTTHKDVWIESTLNEEDGLRISVKFELGALSLENKV